MGERLYVTGYRYDEKTSELQSQEKCWGKLYYYTDVDRLPSFIFLRGLLAGRIMEGNVDPLYMYYNKEKHYKQYCNERYELYNWNIIGHFLDDVYPRNLYLTQEMLRDFTTLFLEDKKNTNTFPVDVESDTWKDNFKFIEEYQWFELTHGG